MSEPQLALKYSDQYKRRGGAEAGDGLVREAQRKTSNEKEEEEKEAYK